MPNEDKNVQSELLERPMLPPVSEKIDGRHREACDAVACYKAIAPIAQQLVKQLPLAEKRRRKLRNGLETFLLDAEDLKTFGKEYRFEFMIITKIHGVSNLTVKDFEWSFLDGVEELAVGKFKKGALERIKGAATREKIAEDERLALEAKESAETAAQPAPEPERVPVDQAEAVDDGLQLQQLYLRYLVGCAHIAGIARPHRLKEQELVDALAVSDAFFQSFETFVMSVGDFPTAPTQSGQPQTGTQAQPARPVFNPEEITAHAVDDVCAKHGKVMNDVLEVKQTFHEKGEK